jgi:hypothetical protein
MLHPIPQCEMVRPCEGVRFASSCLCLDTCLTEGRTHSLFVVKNSTDVSFLLTFLPTVSLLYSRRHTQATNHPAPALCLYLALICYPTDIALRNQTRALSETLPFQMPFVRSASFTKLSLMCHC